MKVYRKSDANGIMLSGSIKFLITIQCLLHDFSSIDDYEI
jgi:hypothetical protein